MVVVRSRQQRLGALLAIPVVPLAMVVIAFAILVHDSDSVSDRGVSHRLMDLMAYPLWDIVSRDGRSWYGTDWGCFVFLANACVFGGVASLLERQAQRNRRGWILRVAVVCGVLAGIAMIVLAHGAQASAEMREWRHLTSLVAEITNGTSARDAKLQLSDLGLRGTDEHRDEGELTDSLRLTHERRALNDGYIDLYFHDGVLGNVDLLPGFDIAFDSVDWLSSSPSRRGFMVRDLINGGVLRGASRDRVIAALGEPQDTPFDHLGELLYEVGGYAHYSFGEAWLVVSLDGTDSGAALRRFVD